ncbi:hypothetical protein SAY86_031269 [Trapa natans]|uniref:Uncharacterized protein n=1 Tax=Trapa natans TaxID=22666 RepID=A0AAN7LQX2_TRANT|nr:hypothetical protein SAY86_031269 [Trapa natans]
MAFQPTEADDFEVILAEQRQEIAAAHALDYDFDYAFHLQMQEISGTSLPSSSRSPPQSPAKTDASAVLRYSDSSSVPATVMLEEMERYAREYYDRELCLAEFKRMREDLAVVFMIGSSLLRSLLSPRMSGRSMETTIKNPTRVYSKGLVSEEYIQDRKVPVVGIGVAIFDFKDNIILEIKKPWLDSSLNNQCSPSCCGESLLSISQMFCFNVKAGRRVPWHYNLSCTDYRTRSHTPEDVNLRSLATEKFWRQCPDCNHMVEPAFGCYHITCRQY